MAKRNTWDGFCGVCGTQVRALEGIVEAAGSSLTYPVCRTRSLVWHTERERCFRKVLPFVRKGRLERF